MAKLSIEDIEVQGKKVIMRVDFNVPLKDGKVDNDKRLRASLPSIQYLNQKGAQLILMSHLGRPKGKVVESMRLKPVADRLSELLEKLVKALPECIGPDVEKAVSEMQDGEIVLLENLRFHAEEAENDPGFAAQLASLGDVYVNDAFGTAHRAHASTEGIAEHFEQRACGYLLKKELEFLGDALDTPKNPFVAIIGGAKISGKIDVIESLSSKVDKLLIGGGMTYTFLKAQGKEIGKSLCEENKLDLAESLLKKAGNTLIFPVDFLATEKLDFDGRELGQTQIVDIDSIPADLECVDIGPKSIKTFSDFILEAKTVVWNGPMGVFEIEESAKGTFAVAAALVQATEKGAVTIIGGGDSASAIEKAGLADKVSHVSTGGGASLEYLEGKQLPGVVALSDK
jgi:phosphoglycerate kinase